MQTNCVCPSGTQRFCINDSDSSHWLWLQSTRVNLWKTWVELSHHFSQVTRVESVTPKIVTRVESRYHWLWLNKNDSGTSQSGVAFATYNIEFLAALAGSSESSGETVLLLHQGSLVLLSIQMAQGNDPVWLQQRWSDSGFLLYDPILFWKNDIRLRSESCFSWNDTTVSKNYPKVYCDAQHTFLYCVYFTSWGKTTLWGEITVRVILPSAEHDWLK